MQKPEWTLNSSDQAKYDSWLQLDETRIDTGTETLSSSKLALPAGAWGREWEPPEAALERIVDDERARAARRAAAPRAPTARARRQHGAVHALANVDNTTLPLYHLQRYHETGELQVCMCSKWFVVYKHFFYVYIHSMETY